MDELPTAVWQTCVHTAAFEEDLSYMAFIQHRLREVVEVNVVL